VFASHHDAERCGLEVFFMYWFGLCNYVT